MPKQINVGILDDHSAVISGYKFQLQGKENINITWEAEFAEKLIPSLNANHTDLLILDASVPISAENPTVYSIQHAITTILETYPELIILVISMHDRRAFINHVMKAGASGYILKDDKESHNNLEKIIRELDAGNIYFSPSIESLVSEKDVSSPRLSKRMTEALIMKATYPNSNTKELANNMKIAPSTVRNLLSTSYRRLGVNNAIAAISKARSLGLIPPKKNNL
ncbi:MAG: response regulator transcription factor [Chloroflexi bacterium]|jgi:DNA-binding NarL/FixJ family response regulator|nr:response regulator transcription factor [Chloroflexota bacterium]MBT6836504.1 response regulator transcription factor [Bacteroidota bacterium]MBT4001936.1 response regulator transcription factor [Chloroflexota bacterium]MBT4305633.1 response regulator transcription factor [Chloroflexota bacterium]MBT4535015.1 response regulator transcription factor [Chloroflexota bacterium]